MKIATLKDSGKLIKHSKDTLLFKKGDIGNDLYIILSGTVHIYANGHTKECEPLVVLKNGDFFGEMALLENFPRTTSAITEEDSLFLVINKENFEKAIQVDPGFAIKIMQSLSSRLRLQTKRYAALEEKIISKSNRSENANIRENTNFLDLASLKNFSMKVEEVPTLLFSEESLLEGFFPVGHNLYHVPEPESYKDFLTEKEKECPVCSSKSKTFLVRNSRLNLERIEDDFRVIYKDFDPLWYNLWSCGTCYYTNFSEEFSKKLTSHHQEGILKKSDIFKKFSHKSNGEDRTIDDVMNLYYLAIQSLLLKKEHSRELGKIWMRLAWLYRDLGDRTMYEKSSLQAFYYYFNYYYDIGTSSVKEDQQLSYILGLFFFKFNNPQSARKHFLKAIVKNGGDLRINDQSYDKIQDIKKITSS